VPSSFQAVAAIVLALLPGALYVWAFERQAGRYGIGASDRVLRFIGGSAVILAIFSTPLYLLYSEYWTAVEAGDDVPLPLAAVPPAFVLIPTIAGTVIGKGLRTGSKWAKALTGPDPAPRAWDFLFQYHVDGWIRCRLKSGVWIAGAYAEANGRQSYAAGYPEPQDLYLASSVGCDPDTGEFELDDDGDAKLGEGGLLLRWEEIEFLEFIEADAESETTDG